MPLKPVVTISGDRLQDLGAELLARMESQGFVPEALIGIATGGLRVVEAMPKSPFMIVMSCRLRRPGTERKEGIGLWRAILRRLPYAVSNLFRVFEDRIQERKELSVPRPTETLDDELDRIRAEVLRRGIERIALIDDAADSGATLACVMKALHERLPKSVDVRSAVITATRPPERSAIIPDFKLFDLTLLRFPWSLDYKGTG